VGIVVVFAVHILDSEGSSEQRPQTVPRFLNLSETAYNSSQDMSGQSSHGVSQNCTLQPLKAPKKKVPSASDGNNSRKQKKFHNPNWSME
jgi:hypothetical protein